MALIPQILHDTRLVHRIEPLMQELRRQKIYVYSFWHPVEDKDSVVRSINKSHKQIIEWAKETGKKEVLIFEDDIHFPSEKGFEYFIQNKPEDYDIYLACTYTPPISNNLICGFHCYIVHERFYDKYLSVPIEAHVDVAMNDLGGKYVFCYPFPALQRKGFSANNKSESDYNVVLKQGDIYK
jgi:hypothetical protein